MQWMHEFKWFRTAKLSWRAWWSARQNSAGRQAVSRSRARAWACFDRAVISQWYENIITHHQTAWNIIKYHQNALVIRHHMTSWSNDSLNWCSSRQRAWQLREWMQHIAMLRWTYELQAKYSEDWPAKLSEARALQLLLPIQAFSTRKKPPPKW